MHNIIRIVLLLVDSCLKSKLSVSVGLNVFAHIFSFACTTISHTLAVCSNAPCLPPQHYMLAFVNKKCHLIKNEEESVVYLTSHVSTSHKDVIFKETGQF